MLRELQRCVKSGVAGWPECVTGLAVAVRVLLIVRLVLLWSFGSVILAASELWAVVATVDGIAGGDVDRSAGGLLVPLTYLVLCCFGLGRRRGSDGPCACCCLWCSKWGCGFTWATQ